jgi:hypothetical protein
VAGIWYSSAIWNTTSGAPICHPSAYFGGGGVAAGSPSRAPPSTQRTSVSISRSLRLGSFRNLPCCRSACQGGIARVRTLSRIAAAHGRASRKVMSDIGATSPGR